VVVTRQLERAASDRHVGCAWWNPEILGTSSRAFDASLASSGGEDSLIDAKSHCFPGAKQIDDIPEIKPGVFFPAQRT
jgi:hypothetical protein